MANCVNKNSPEFKKLVQLTGYNPEDVSIAIGMWQNHYNSEEMPSSNMIRAMMSNRQSYGGMDQYLAAISKPIAKYDIEQAKKNLPNRVKSISKVLESIVPGIKFTIHDNVDSFGDEVKKRTGNTKNKNDNAFYDPTTKEIHLSLSSMLKSMSKSRKMSLNAAEHEAVHPILDVIEGIHPGTISELYKQLQKVEKEFGLNGEYTVKFAGRYNPSVRAEEAVTEFIADIASGNLDLSKKPKNKLNYVIEFFAKLFEGLGLDIRPYIGSEPLLVRFANELKNSFGEGRKPNINIGNDLSIDGKIKFQKNEELLDKTPIDELYLQSKNKNLETNEIASNTRGKQQEIGGVYRSLKAAASDTGRDNSTSEKNRPRGWNKERFLRRWAEEAKANGVWIEKIDDLVESELKSGNESETYISKDRKDVIKVNRLALLDEDDSGVFTRDFNSFLDRIISHNAFAPKVPYSIIGGSNNKKGEISIVLKQPYIKDGKYADLKDIYTFLKKIGFKPSLLENGVQGFTDGRFEISDVKPENVIESPDGDLAFIDIDINSVDSEEIDDDEFGIKFQLGEEKDSIKSKAIADGSFLKAPNGKPTNLTEDQWLTVRLNNFKYWFGPWDLEDKLLSLFDKNNKIDYERLKDIADRIGEGTSTLARLNPKEEQGRIEGGRRNVEASIVVGAKARTERQDKSSYRRWSEHKEAVAGQENALEDYAKHEGIWFDYSIFETEYKYYDKGMEAKVYDDKNDPKFVIKTVGYDFVKQQTPLEYLDRIALHNYLFPDTKYELIGFTRDKQGNFNFVVKQQFITGKQPSNVKIQKYMLANFDAKSIDIDNVEFRNSNYVIRDLHQRNIIEGNDGILYFIDPIVELNYREDNKGGLRDSIESENTTSKVVDQNGEPLVVWHGTPNQFNEFDINKIGESTDTGMWGKGFYFSSKSEYAKTYSERNNKTGRVIPVFLSIKAPLILKTKNDIPKINTPNETIDDLRNAGINYSTLFRDNVIKNGKDGVIVNLDFKFRNDYELVAFYPNQIKLADGSNTTFDRNTNDIRFQKNDLKSFQEVFQERYKAIDDLKDQGVKGLKINSDASVTLFHGTSIENAKKIKEIGFNEGTYFSVFKNGSKNGDSPIDIAKRKYGKNGIVLEIKIDPRFIEPAAAGSELYAPSALININDVYEGESSIKFQLAGENANLEKESRDNLELARKLEYEGIDPEIIFLRTYWQRGVDGKWRTEFEDVELVDIENTLNLLLKDSNKDFTFEEIFDFPELIKYYPDARNIKVRFRSDRTRNYEAIYYSSKKLLEFNSFRFREYARGFASDREVLLGSNNLRGFQRLVAHELAHFVQTQEGWAFGGNPANITTEQVVKYGAKYRESDREITDDQIRRKIYKSLAGEVEADNIMKRLSLSSEERQLQSFSSTEEDIDRKDQIVSLSNDTSPIKFSKNDLIANTDKYPSMTQDGENYIFFNYRGSRKVRNSTQPLPYLKERGFVENIIKVPIGKVYPLEEDPLKIISKNELDTYKLVSNAFETIKSKGYSVLIYNGNSGVEAAIHTVYNLKRNNDQYKSNSVKESPLGGYTNLLDIIKASNNDSELLSPFRNYNIELDNALTRYSISNKKVLFNNDLKNIIDNLEYREEIGEATIFNDYKSLKSNQYIRVGNEIRKIISVKKLEDNFHEYYWSLPNQSIIYKTKVLGKSERTTNLSNRLKFSLSETENEENNKDRYQESVDFGRLVSDLAAKIKEGTNDINDLRKEANVNAETWEVFQQAFDLAWVRAGKKPSNLRQTALYRLIVKLPSGDKRPTAQKMYRGPLHDALVDARVDLNMLKQILPDEDLIKDTNINQTWKRLLSVVDDIGDYVSQTLDRSRKFEIGDLGDKSKNWSATAIGFSDMLAYVDRAVKQNPENKQKLLDKVKKEAKESQEQNPMLGLLELAITASGEISIGDLSKIIRSGTEAGRVLNVIKHYIASGNFGKVKADIAAAQVIADNDAILQNASENQGEKLLDVIDEIKTLISLSQLDDQEKEEFMKENSSLITDLKKYLKGLGIIPKGGIAPNDKRYKQRASNRINLGLESLKDTLKRTNPSLIKSSKSSFDPDILKSIKQIVRGIIDLHGTNPLKIKTELDKILKSSGILMSADDIMDDIAIKEYIANTERHKIREGAIESLGASNDNYTKMVLDMILKTLNIPGGAASNTDKLLNALDRGEITKDIIDAVIDEINLIEDEDRKKLLLERIENKFSILSDSAIPTKNILDASNEALGKITREIVSAYIVDPDKSISILAGQAIDKLGLNPDQAKAWASEISKQVKKRLEKSRDNKIKSLLRTKITDKKKAESLEEKILKIILTKANLDGTIPSETEVEGKMIDIKQVFADKYGVRLNDPRAIAKIIQLTNLLRVARTQARKNQIHAEILLAISNLKLSPNRYVRYIKSGISELPNFVMANILSGINSAYKATIGGLFNSGRAYMLDSLVGFGVDTIYKSKNLTKQVYDSIKLKKDKLPATHKALTWRIYWDVMRNGSASVSQSNIPEHGLSNFDNNLNNFFPLRILYAPFRHLSAIDMATMKLNSNRLAQRKAVNSLIEFGSNNVVLNGQSYSRTMGGSSWYKVDSNNRPTIDSSTGNIEVVHDEQISKVLTEIAKQNISTTEFVAEAERLLGYAREEQIYNDIIDEWNALVDLAHSNTASKEELQELKRLNLHKEKLKKVKSMDEFKSMSGNIKRFISAEIFKQVQYNQNAAITRLVHLETGSYSAQGIEVPGVPAGILYQVATMLDVMIKTGLGSDNLFVKLLTGAIAIPAKLYSFLITKAPSIGYGAALMFSPISFLVNLGNLLAYTSGRPFMRITYDAKDKAWRYNGLRLQDIKNATGISSLEAKDLIIGTNKKVLQVLKEGYTAIGTDNNTFELKDPEIYTIGGQGGKIDIGSLMAKQAMSTIAALAIIDIMMDCEEEDCEFSPIGKKIIDFVGVKGYGAAKNWLDQNGWFNLLTGHAEKTEKFGDPHENTVRLLKVGDVELKIPLNEMNNAVMVTTIARINDELNAGVKLNKSDIMLRYMIYSNFDLLENNMDMSVEGLNEFKELFLAMTDETYTKDKKINKASSSVSKRLMAALTPKMLNDLDKLLLDAENKNLISVENIEGFSEQLRKKVPLNVPFLRRYVQEKDPEHYKSLPFTYEWTDWQLWMAKQVEEGDEEDVKVGEFLINLSGRSTEEAPQGEAKKIKEEALKSGGNEYIDNGYFKLGKEFDNMLNQKLNDSEMEILLLSGSREDALDLIREKAKEVKESPEFNKIKNNLKDKNK